MASAARGALRPYNEAPRNACQGVRGTTIYVNNGSIADTVSALGFQRLKLLGIIGQRASMLADLAWEPVS